MSTNRLWLVGLKIILWVVVLIYWLFGFPQKVGHVWIDWRHDLVPDDLLSQIKITHIEDIFKEEEKEPKLDEEAKKTKERMLLEIITQALDKNSHSAPTDKQYDKTHLDQICTINQIVCDFTQFNWDYKFKNKLKYQAIIIYLINHYDNFLNTSNWLADTITSLRMNKQWGRRWYAGHHSILMNTLAIDDHKEFWEVLTHEFGHIIDLWILVWNWPQKNSRFTEFGKERFYKDDPSIQYYEISWLNEDTRKANSSRMDFVSWYWMTNPFEDFAESINLYLNHYWVFKKMSDTSSSLDLKFKFMQNLFNDRYLNYWRANIDKIKSNPERRPWDSTNI